MTLPPSRRSFLRVTSLTLAGLATPMRRAIAWTPAIGRQTPAALADPSLSAETLRMLARTAVSSAMSAGATFADVRAAERHRLTVRIESGSTTAIWMESDIGYGIRAAVNGIPAFVYGTIPTRAIVDASARAAAIRAGEYARIALPANGKPRHIAAAPATTGVWESPADVPPFSVPLDDYSAALMALRTSIARRWATQLARLEVTVDVETRVIANSEGTLVTQHLTTLTPLVMIAHGGIYESIPEIPESGGFERLVDPQYADRLNTAAEQLGSWGKIGQASLDIGRYDVVFDGRMSAQLIGTTVSRALELDRVLGDEQEATGTSYVPAPTGQLAADAPLFAPILSMQANPSSLVRGIRWDDEGVPVEPFSLIESGRVVDFHRSRASTGALADRGGYVGQAPLHGGAMAASGRDALMDGGRAVAVAAGREQASERDLIRSIQRGVFVRGAATVSMGLGMTQGSVTPFSECTLYRIDNGTITGRIQSRGFQFRTKTLLREGLAAVGDASTLRRRLVTAHKGLPSATMSQVVEAPALLCHGVDFIDTTIRIG